MKNIAVLIYGQYREFELAIKSWHFMNLSANIDYYISTWDITYEKFPDNSKSHISRVSKDKIEKHVKLSGYNIVSETESGLISSSSCMMYHIREVIKLMVSSGTIYDAVILIRPDVWVHEGLDFNTMLIDEQITPNTILGYGPIHKDPINNYVVMDNLFATSYDTIKKLSSLPLTPFRDIHNVLASHFVENDIIVQSFKGESDLSIVRSNARLLEPHQLTIENIKDKAKHWRNAYCL
jgi:hypothetical protein